MSNGIIIPENSDRKVNLLDDVGTDNNGEEAKSN